jgi:hypothetical protein
MYRRSACAQAFNSLTVLMLLLASGLPAQEKAEPEAPPPFRAELGAGEVPLDDGLPGEFSGPIHLSYGGMKVDGDRLSYLTKKISKSAQPILDSVRIDSGPGGPEATRIHLDTRACTLPNVGFRGLLTPEAFIGRYAPLDEKATNRRYIIDLPNLGYFHGELLTSKGWEPYGGRADRAELIVVFDVVGDDFTNFRFETIHIFGRNADADRPRESTFLVSSSKKITDKEMVKLLGTSERAGRVDADSFTIHFNELGKVMRIQPGGKTEVTGPGISLPMTKPNRVRMEPGK